MGKNKIYIYRDMGKKLVWYLSRYGKNKIFEHWSQNMGQVSFLKQSSKKT